MNKTTLIHHPVNTLFDVDLLQYAGGKAVLQLRLREQFVVSDGTSIGYLGLAIECAAKMAGRAAIGNCFLSEYELNVRSEILGRDFIVSSTIENSNHRHAVFVCEVTEVDSTAKRLIAVCHGTLTRTSKAFADVL